MLINLIFQQSIASLPASFVAALEKAASMLDAAVTDNITVNIEVGYGDYPQDTARLQMGPQRVGLTTETCTPIRRW
jgi:hypothetical protein